jgi:hypothetical protein
MYAPVVVTIFPEYYPVIFARFEGETSVEDADAFNDFLRESMSRATENGDDVVALIDSLATTKVSPAVRKSFADLIRSVEKAWYQRMVGVVVLYENVLMRGALTAISWVSPLALDILAARDLNQGRELLLKAYNKAGVEPPAELDRCVKEQAS